MIVRRTSSLMLSLALCAVLAPAAAQASTTPSGDRSEVELAAERHIHAEYNAQRAAGRTRDGVTHTDVTTAPALRGATDILAVSRAWADQLDDASFSHNPSYGDQYGQWRAIAENIGTIAMKRTADGAVTTAEATQAADQLMGLWWSSTGHRRFMMDGRWEHFAVGVDIKAEQRGAGETWVMFAVVNFRDHDGSTIPGTLYDADDSQQTNTTPTADETAAANQGQRFRDVPAGHGFERDIEALADAGVTSGCGGGNFCPDAVVTRAQMAAFLHRALDLPAGSASFSDVGRAHAFSANIAALAAAGVTTGCGGSRFCPDAPVTRAQMAAFLQRALDLPVGSATFADVPAGNPFAGAIAALAQAGITSGCGGGQFCPDAPVTRAQMAAFLRRAGVLD